MRGDILIAGPEPSSTYGTFEINAIGNLLSVYKNPNYELTDRRSRIMVPRIGRTVDGTVNDDTDTDTGWVLEVAIRFTDYPTLYDRERPVDGEVWRVGLNRCGGKTNAQYSQWSPSQTDRPNFHVPEDFGRITFSANPVGTPVGVADSDDNPAPAAITLLGNSPNPFNAATTITFSLADGGDVALDIYDVTGRKVRSLVGETLPAGAHAIVWDGRNGDGVTVSSGVYFTRVRAGAATVTGRMAFVK